MALRIAGSQTFPIDIEDEDTVLIPPRKKKRKIEISQEDEIEVIAVDNITRKRKETSERKPEKELRQSKTSKSSTFASRKSFKALHEKFKSLESRLESLENCLERVSQVFLNKSLSFDPFIADVENSNGYNEAPALTIEDADNLPEEETENVNGSKKQDNNVLIGSGEEACIEHENNESSATTERIEHSDSHNNIEGSNVTESENVGTSSPIEIIEENQNDSVVSITNCENAAINQASSSKFDNHKASAAGEIIQQNFRENFTLISSTNQDDYFIQFNNRDASATTESIQHSICPNDAQASVLNQVISFEKVPESLQETREPSHSSNGNGETLAEDEEIDSKWELIDLVSMKREVNLHRDDQGRVLMFLSCAFKKLSRPVPVIAATSGVYLGDEFKNEYNFVSNRRLSDVRIEAEIRAAWFGIELVKGLYCNKANVVCLMVISSCPPLVKLMKERSFSVVYPKYLSCKCENAECQHADTRWNSSHSLGGSQREILPKLIMSMRGLMVHWCHVDNISDEEKKILEKYSMVVQASLNDHYALNKSR